MRNEDDIQEVVKLLRSKDNHCVTLWCMGKSQPSKRVLELSDSESDEEVGIKSKPKQTQNILKNWNELTIMSMNLNVSMVIQYRIWPETIDVGCHDSLENPPKGSFFKSQGQKGNPRASTPPASSASSASVTEQATLIANLHSTYIQQIKELHSLLEIGPIMEHYINRGIHYCDKWTN